MATETFTNSLGGVSMRVPAGTAPDSIPEPFRSQISTPYLAFLENPQGVIGDNVPNVRFEPLKRWFDAQANLQEYGMTIHRAEIYGTTQQDLTVFCTSLNQYPVRRYRLPDTRWNLDEDPALVELYTWTDGIILEEDAFSTSQFTRITAQGPFIDHFEDLEVDMDDCVVFFRASTGDSLIAVGDSVLAFYHDSRTLAPVGKVEQVLTEFFDNDLEYGSWDPIPYR